MRYVVLERDNFNIVPCSPLAKIHLFDDAGVRINTWSFTTGWRMYATGARFSRVEELDSDVITIETEPVVNGRCVAKQCFAFSGDNLWFIRMENPAGRVIGNIYAEPGQTLGVSVKGNNEEGWLALLRSKHPVEALAALTFLGGFHTDRRYVGVNSGHKEDEEQASAFRQLRANAEVMASVEQYLRSDCKWLREAAEVVVKGEDESSLEYRLLDLDPDSLLTYVR